MELDELTERALVNRLPELHAKAMQALKTGYLIAGEVTPLADARDYFMHLTLRCKTREQAVDLMLRLGRYEAVMKERGEEFYTAFFFTLACLLQLRFQIIGLPGEEISYEAFEKSFANTLEKLGLLEGSVHGSRS